MAPNDQIFAITNVQIFNGDSIDPPSTIIVDGEKILAIEKGNPDLISLPVLNGRNIADTIDGENGILIPGLMDCHVHVKRPEAISRLCGWGVTTAFDMASWPAELWKELQKFAVESNLTRLFTAGVPATAPGSRHSQFPGMPSEALLTDPEQVKSFVANRVSDGADYIKSVADVPVGPSQEVLNAVVKAARENGKRSVTHATIHKAALMALESGTDVLTHVPMDQPLDKAFAERMLAVKMIAVPTLTMEKALCKIGIRPNLKFSHSLDSVTALLDSGVTVLAGTDCNDSPMVDVPHGKTMHQELELLVEAGMSPRDALRAATSLPAAYFELSDRGVIETGRLADLVLLAENPLENISATQSMKRVWCRGTEIPVALE